MHPFFGTLARRLAGTVSNDARRMLSAIGYKLVNAANAAPNLFRMTPVPFQIRKLPGECSACRHFSATPVLGIAAAGTVLRTGAPAADDDATTSDAMHQSPSGRLLSAPVLGWTGTPTSQAGFGSGY